MSVGMILYIIAAVCFFLAAVGWPNTGPLNLTALGLFFLALALIFGALR